MMSPRLVLLLLAFISACLLPRTWADEAGAVIDEEDEYVDAEVPQPALLVAYKNVKTPKIVQGCNVTMSISLFNVGTGTANDISVEDTLPPNFSLIEGSLKASFKYLDPGATVSMEYIGIPSVGDQKLLAKPAKVVYKTGKDKAHHLLSTSPFMEILSTRQNVELHLVKVGKYVSLGVLRTRRDWQNSMLVILIASVAFVAYTTISSVSSKRADALRRAAERDLGVAGN